MLHRIAFEQPYREQRDHSGFGPFRVERGRYEAAVRELDAAVEADGA